MIAALMVLKTVDVERPGVLDRGKKNTRLTRGRGPGRRRDGSGGAGWNRGGIRRGTGGEAWDEGCPPGRLIAGK